MCNILFLSDDFPPETNAAATRVYERAVYWQKWGVSTKFITNFPNKFLGKEHVGYSNSLYRIDDMGGMEVIRVKTYIATKKDIFHRMIDQVSYMITSFIAGLFVKKPDVIISTTPQFFCGLSGLALSKLRGLPFILEVADIWTDSIKGTGASSGKVYDLLKMIEAYLYRKSDAIIALTGSFREEMMRRGIDGGKIFVIRNGINRELFNCQETNSDIINKYGLKNKIVIGYIGSLGSAQGLENVIGAARIANDRHLDSIVFMLVGDGAEKEHLVKLSVGLSNVIFVPGQPKNNIPDYLSVCDIGLVHLKNSAVFSKVIPSKIFEIMAMGIPVLLVSPAGEASELIENNNIGEWIQSGNPELMTNALLRMSADKGALKMYSDNCLSAISVFTREEQARKVLDVVDAII